MLTLEEFNKIEVGDEVETFELLPALSNDPLILHCTGKNLISRFFTMTFCGITLGDVSCVETDGNVKWKFS